MNAEDKPWVPPTVLDPDVEEAEYQLRREVRQRFVDENSERKKRLCAVCKFKDGTGLNAGMHCDLSPTTTDGCDCPYFKEGK